MLTQSAIEELKAELASLEEMRRKLNETIEAKIAGIKAILSPGPQLGFFEAPARNGNGALHVPPGYIHINGKPLSGIGLRAAIKTVLAGQEKGLRPAEIADALTESGYEPTGKTPTSRLVYGEVHRLKQLKVLEPTTNGKYRLAAT